MESQLLVLQMIVLIEARSFLVFLTHILARSSFPPDPLFNLHLSACGGVLAFVCLDVDHTKKDKVQYVFFEVLVCR